MQISGKCGSFLFACCIEAREPSDIVWLGITALLDRPIKGIPSIKIVLNGVTFIKQEFKKGELRLRLDFKPLL